MTEISPNSANERRRYFRVEDEIVLAYRPMASDELQESEDARRRLADTFSLTANLDYLSQQSKTQLHRIQRSNPDVADYLETLEKKIDLVARALVMSHSEFVDQPTCHVNLSATGIAFDAREALKEGETLELKLVVPPSLAGIVVYGKVVYCQEKGGGGFRVGVDFTGIQESDQEFLIRHVVKRQMAELREQKQNAD